ncbi:hypothetical protein EGW08_005456 [Elysia chlorotica]|uniref:Uncharacterized protein n=1 Tax=Elysia chlorotica TaxID=188477 RepID=A0A433TYY8_ELYCH|nr:hypothetical protein EGW08_005456 [Elysia chlorotica]
MVRMGPHLKALSQKQRLCTHCARDMAIRQNSGNLDRMVKAVKAVLPHVASTEQRPMHDNCPEGPESWCGFKRDKASYKHKNGLPDAVVEYIKPVFDDLATTLATEAVIAVSDDLTHDSAAAKCFTEAALEHVTRERPFSSDNELYQLVQSPTHKSGHTLDWVIARESDNFIRDVKCFIFIFTGLQEYVCDTDSDASSASIQYPALGSSAQEPTMITLASIVKHFIQERTYTSTTKDAKEEVKDSVECLNKGDYYYLLDQM